MIQLTRTKDKRWIFQKNISSDEIINSYLAALNELNNEYSAQSMIDNLRHNNVYRGRSSSGSLSTMGVRFSQMCFYMFGYNKTSDQNGSKTFIPTQTTSNILNLSDQNSLEIGKNMLINLFAIQYPHPYSKTDSSFKIYAGRLILTLLLDEKIGQKLYMDECIYFLPFIKTINVQTYNQLTDSILKFRELSFLQKDELFKNVTNCSEIFANCMHEFNYYFLRIFKSFHVFNTFEDPDHNNGQLFRFRHGNPKKHDTFRNDSIVSGAKKTGYFCLNEELKPFAKDLLEKYHYDDTPTAMDNTYIISKEDWINDLYEIEFIRYCSIVFPNYNHYSEIINSLDEMVKESKFGSIDGKSFEKSLVPVFQLFDKIGEVTRISGSGDTDLVCQVCPDEETNINDYKINIEAKSRNSHQNMNVERIVRHISLHGSSYAIVVSPRFSKGNKLDIEGKDIVVLQSEVLARYCSKECLNSESFKARFNPINEIIRNHMGEDISPFVEALTNSNYGIQVGNE